MKRLRLAILGLLLVTGPISALSLDTLPDYQDAGMKLYVRGTQLLQENDFVSAADELRRAVKARPDMAEAFHNLGYALEKTGDLKNAAAAYERAISLKPTYASAFNNLGFLLATAEVDKARAVQLCRRAVELEPNSAAYRDSLGWASYKAGRLEDAVMHFQAALKLDANYAKSWFNLGLCEFSRKNYAEAARNFTGAIQLNTNLLKAYLPLAESFERMQQTNRALNVYQQALSKAPETSPVRKHIERQIKRLTAGSKSYYFSNVKQLQGSAKLTDFMRRRGKTGNLAGTTSKVVDPLDSSSTFTPVSLAQAPTAGVSGTDLSDYALGGEPTYAAPVVPMARSMNAAPATTPRFDSELSVNAERSLEKKYSLCQSYIERGLVQEAAKELENIVTVAGTSSIGRQARNLLLRARKMIDERNAERAGTHLTMGKDFIRSGKYDMAETELKKSLSLTPENAEAHKDLALLYYNQNRFREAYESSKRAIALDRTMKEAYVVLASL
ncbi:MAG TPA: tetratricopeptide repeat protein, partial [Candidatus Ozemobacteraceae bacterium]|nr:tetratricopeptide repeat protein [Candidatus Ozemobacteraceae bacterium]